MAVCETQVLGLLLNIDLDSLFWIAAVSFTGRCMRAVEESEIVIRCPSLESNPMPLLTGIHLVFYYRLPSWWLHTLEQPFSVFFLFLL